MKMQLLAFSLLLLSQLTSCMHTQPHFYGSPDYIWGNVFDGFKEQNEIQGFYNPRRESDKITFDQMLTASIWHPNNQNEKTTIDGVKTKFLTHFAGLTNLEYKQLYTYSNYLPKEPVVGLKVRTSGIIKVTKYCEETQQNKNSYYLMELFVSYDTAYWPNEEFQDRKVTMDEVIASISWKEIKSADMVFQQKEDILNFVSICGKTDPELYYFNEHKKLQIALRDDEAFFEGGSFITTAENYFNLPVDNSRRNSFYADYRVILLVVGIMILMMRK